MRPPSTLLQLNAILVLFCAAAMLFTNEADGQQDTLGLGGNPTSKDGKVEINLPSGTKLIKNKEEFEEQKYEEYQHNDKTFEPCNVKFDNDSNIEVFYDDLASMKGCTVDLLVNKMDQIEFVAKVEDKERNCVTDKINDNLLPFIFNEANKGLAALTNGPEDGGDDDCANKEKCERDKCIKRTMYAIEWNRGLQDVIDGHLDQVGESVDAWFVSGMKMDVKMAVGNVPENKPLVTIKALDVEGAQPVEFPDGGSENMKPVCNKPRMATPPPAIWKVKSENKEFNGKYFVTFHFFPQKSAGADGPNCNGTKQLSFIFSKDYAAGLLMVSPLPIEPTTTSTMNTTGSTTTPASTEPPPTGLSTMAIVGIVAGAIALVVVVAVLVYCLCCRGKGEADEKEEEEEPAAAAEDEDVEKAEGELPAASV